MRKTGQRAPLTQKLGENAGMALGAHLGGAPGAIIGRQAGGTLGKLSNSTIWNTLAAATKAKISDLISSGDEAGAIALAKRNGVVPTEASAAPSAAGSVPPSEGVQNANTRARANTGADQEGQAVPAANAPGGGNAGGQRTGAEKNAFADGGADPRLGRRTVVKVAGQPGPGYPAQYKLSELDDVNASHNGLTFQPNASYKLLNDRVYSNPVNQGKIASAATPAEFDPEQHTSNNRDATTGPPVDDSEANTLSGNGRSMMQQIVYARNPKGTAALRADLKAKADLYGYDPAEVDRMRQPSLRRVIDDSVFPTLAAKQDAITDFNKTATASLTPSERAMSDSRRVSSSTLDDMASRLDAKGPAATMAQVLEGKSGGEVLQNLIDDGVVSRQEHAGLVDDGELTKAGKDRVAQLMVGRFFKSSQQLEGVADSVRGKVERMAAPLAQAEAKPGWNLTPDVQSALELLDQARKANIKNVGDFVKQDGLFGKDKWSDKAITLAKAMSVSKATEVTAAARQYAQDAAYADKGPSLMGDAPTPAESFADSFGALKSGAESDAAKLLAASKKPIGQMARVPELSGKRDASFDPDATTRFHIGRSTFEPFELDNKDADVIPHTSAHVANSHLIEFLGRAVGRPLNDAWQKVGAFNFPPEQLSDLQTVLEKHAQEFNATSAPVVAKLKNAIQEAQTKDQSLVFSKDHASLSPEEREEFLDQELNHVRQRLLGPTAKHLGDSAGSFVSSPIGIKARTKLQNDVGYPLDKNDHLAALEIGERLMRRGAHTELGISGAERDVLADQYMRSLRSKYGNKAETVIDRIREASRP